MTCSAARHEVADADISSLLNELGLQSHVSERGAGPTGSMTCCCSAASEHSITWLITARRGTWTGHLCLQIRVFCRLRPAPSSSAVCNSDGISLALTADDGKRHSFSFDKVRLLCCLTTTIIWVQLCVPRSYQQSSFASVRPPTHVQLCCRCLRHQHSRHRSSQRCRSSCSPPWTDSR